MSDCENGGRLEGISDRALDQCVRLVVDARRRFVQHKDLGFSQNSSCDANQLSLARAEIVAALRELIENEV